MFRQVKVAAPVFRRRDLGALALGAASGLVSTPAAAQGVFERALGELSSGLQHVKGEVREELAYILGLMSYVYGYPLVIMDVTRKVLTAAPAPNSEGTAAPINQFAKMPQYVSPDFKNVVRISLNSLWSTGWLDLEQEPIVLSVPDTKGRYYVMSVMNMWTDVFGSAGKRTTGTAPGSFLIAGPKWQGTAPAGIKETYRSSTRYAWILGQTQVNGPDDFAAVNAIQADYKLTPLSAWGRPYSPPLAVAIDSRVDTKVTPVDQVAGMDAGTFFKRLALLMRENPPNAADGRALEELKLLGIEPGKNFDIDKVDPAVARGLERAVQDVPTKMQEGVRKIKTVNGWIQPTNIGRYGTDYSTRAGIAWLGLGADMQEDTIYPTAYVDGDGTPLDSANKYTMHYEKDQFQPTNATWSISQYQGNFYVQNALNRYLQAESPGRDKEANWLPTPSGVFNVTIRNYWPKATALDGTYKNPRITKVS
jgi:hypothetical protein